MYQVFVCHNPKKLFTPLIYNSPHSGRIYQKSFLNQTSLSLKEIRVSEDFFVDQLLTSVTDNGSFFLEACFPRSFVDVNRSHNDLDSRLINKLVFNRMNSRTAAGLGVIPRVVGDGIEIYSKNQQRRFREKKQDFNSNLLQHEKDGGFREHVFEETK